jgi:hypothetical protein
LGVDTLGDLHRFALGHQQPWFRIGEIVVVRLDEMWLSSGVS